MVGGDGFFKVAKARTGRERETRCASARAANLNEQISSCSSHALMASIVRRKKKTAAEKNPDCGTIGAGWRDRPRDRDL